MRRENLITLFSEFERYAENVAVIQSRGYRKESLTYGMLVRRATALALTLKARSIRTGDRVLLWAPNSAEWLIAFWACLLRGAVLVPMDDAATPEFASRVAAQAAVKLIVSTASHPPLATEAPTLIVSDLPFTSETDPPASPGKTSAEKNVRWHQALPDEPITRTHLAQILFTSGTTAEPRGVLLTHGNFLANLEPLEQGIAPYRKYERWFHPLRFVTVVPLSHVYGQFMVLFVPPLLGATVVFESSSNPRDILHTIQHERATALVAVPRILDLLRASLERDTEDSFAKTFASASGKKFLRRAWLFRRIHKKLGWKFWAFICGGAALSSNTEDFFQRLGYAVVQGYGMTETASLISLNHPFRAAKGSIGKILPGRQFHLAEDGEILVRGENVSPGYWQNVACQDTASAENASAAIPLAALNGGAEKIAGKVPEVQGWLRTGDLGELDAAGNLRFRGRKKNVIVSSAGLNIYPDDLESALRTQPQIRDCLVISFPRPPGTKAESTGFRPSWNADDNDNSEACAILLVNPSEINPTAIATQAVAATNAALADFQQIRLWLIWPDPDFPRTSTGKPRQSEIAARAAELIASAPLVTANPRSASLPTASQPSNSAVTQLLARVSQTPNAALTENLNLSSLDRVELLSTLESQFHVELNETVFAQAKTVADLQNLLTQPQAQPTRYLYAAWAQNALVRAIRLVIYYALVWPATQFLGHPQIKGRENLAHLKGPVLIISNHITRRADIGLILAALPARLRHRVATAMAGETLQEMRKPPGTWSFPKRYLHKAGYWLVTALFNVFPLPQFSGFRESFRFAGESADRRYSLLVFPEGHVNDTLDGRMDKFQPGIGLLAQNLKLPIIPMRLEGLAQMKQAHRRMARPGEITVHIGAPITFPDGTSPEEITAKLESMVRDLR
jgi:long-chain acyl-CoA synthetase